MILKIDMAYISILRLIASLATAHSYCAEKSSKLSYCYCIPLYRSHAIVSKTAAATGFSSTYIRKLAMEGKAGRTPGKNRHQKKGKFGKLDDFDLGCNQANYPLLLFAK